MIFLWKLHNFCFYCKVGSSATILWQQIFITYFSTSSHGDSSSEWQTKLCKDVSNIKKYVYLYEQEPLGDKVKCHSLSICGDITRSFKKCHLLLHTCWSTFICPHRSDIFQFILNIAKIYFKVIDIVIISKWCDNFISIPTQQKNCHFIEELIKRTVTKHKHHLLIIQLNLLLVHFTGIK